MESGETRFSAQITEGVREPPTGTGSIKGELGFEGR